MEENVKAVNKNAVPKHIMSEFKRYVLPFSNKNDWLAIKDKVDSITKLDDKLAYIKKCVEFIKTHNNVDDNLLISEEVK